MPASAEVVRRKLATVREAVERLRAHLPITAQRLRSDGMLEWAVERGLQIAAEALFDAGFVIVSKDDDFQQPSFLHGAPPKAVWHRARAAAPGP